MTIDTNIIIAYLEGDALIIETLSQWQMEGKSLFLSTVAETEILSFPGFSPEEHGATILFLEENFTSFPFDRALARIAAQIRQSTRIKFPDAAIAATALITNTPLVTRNVRDFQKIRGIRMVTV